MIDIKENPSLFEAMETADEIGKLIKKGLDDGVPSLTIHISKTLYDYVMDYHYPAFFGAYVQQCNLKMKGTIPFTVEYHAEPYTIVVNYSNTTKVCEDKRY